jgi:hypothetical protein
MKKGDVVKFRNEVDPGDTKVRMILLEDPDGGRVLVGDVCIVEDTGIKQAVTATSRYLVEDLELVSNEDMAKLGEAAI